MLIEIVPLETSECSGPAVVNRVDGRVADIDRIWLDVLTARAFAAGLLLDATSGVNSFAASTVEEVAKSADFSGLAAIEGVIDEEDMITGVKVWISAGIEVDSVWLRNRATL